jgi:hypothetical protein
MEVIMSNAIVITGHYGAGKTNFTVNAALEIRRRKPHARITVCDLDIVNPYFRTADFSALFADENIRTAAPRFANSSLDIPAVNFDMAGELADSDYLLVDVGGDDTGAIALGRYADILTSADSFSMLCVINRYRCLTSSADEAYPLMLEIEHASRLKHTAIVNNSNLGSETDADTVARSADFADEVCRLSGLPLCCTAVKKDVSAGVKRPFPCKIYVKTVWDD